MINVLETLSKIDLFRKSSYSGISDGGKLKISSNLKTKISGLYWIYTSYTINDIINCKYSLLNNSVNISFVANLHKELKYCCKETIDNNLLVYNGIGGIGEKNGGGLRERILQEFNGGEGTGSLAILKTNLNDIDKWYISYLSLSDLQNTGNINLMYSEWSIYLEHIWRLQYGWPLLCQN